MRIKTLVFVALMAIAAQTATAAPITFTFSTTGSGTWHKSDGTSASFDSSALLEVTLVTDTAQLQNPIIQYGTGNPLPGVIGYGVGTTVTGSLALGGVSLGALANPAYVFRSGNLIGFGDSVDFDIFGVSSPTFASYMLDSSFGSTTSGAYFPGVTTIALASGESVTLAALSTAHTATFAASAVPEPATLSLLLIGMAALPFRRRRSA
jgi:hypothetical protein